MLALLLAVSSLQSTPDFEKAWAYATSTKSHAVLVMQKGKVVFERGAAGWSMTAPHLLASGSKSFTGVAAACLIKDGVLSSFDEKVAESLTEWKSDPTKSKITYRQLLSLSSGLDPASKSEVRHCPSEKEMLETDVVGQPGQKFRYGARAFNIFSLAMERKLKGEKLHIYLQRKMFGPLGIKVTWSNTNSEGRVQFGGGGQCSARDWAIFGESIRLGGLVNGKIVCDTKALAEVGQKQGAGGAYGLSWWLASDGNPRTGGGSQSSFKNFRLAAGAGGQMLYILPELDTIVIRFGPLLGRFKSDEFLDAMYGRH